MEASDKGKFVPDDSQKGTPLGEMADQTVMGVFITRIMGLFPLVTRVVEVLERVTLLLWSLLLILLTCHEDIEAVNREELLYRMTHNMREAAMDALSVSIQDKPGSYITAAEGSRRKQSATKGLKLDPSISKAKFHLLFLENLCEGVYVTIPRKVVEMVSTQFANTFYGYFTIKRIAFPVVEYYVRNNRCKYGLTRIMMNSKGFFFFQIKTSKRLEDVLEMGHG
nr:hypothetical protein [Tanacetum cinerariifolium]